MITLASLSSNALLSVSASAESAFVPRASKLHAVLEDRLGGKAHLQYDVEIAKDIKDIVSLDDAQHNVSSVKCGAGSLIINVVSNAQQSMGTTKSDQTSLFDLLEPGHVVVGGHRWKCSGAVGGKHHITPFYREITQVLSRDANGNGITVATKERHFLGLFHKSWVKFRFEPTAAHFEASKKRHAQADLDSKSPEPVYHRFDFDTVNGTNGPTPSSFSNSSDRRRAFGIVSKAVHAVSNAAKNGFSYSTGHKTHTWDIFAFNYDTYSGSAKQPSIEMFHAGQKGKSGGHQASTAATL